MIRWCEKERIDLIVVGPEVPLSQGIVDALSTPERLVFGPCRAAAALEADKAFAKSLMKQVAVPTAEGRTFSTANSARRWILRGIDRELQGHPLLSEAYDLIGFMHSSDDRGSYELPELTPGIRDVLDKRGEPCVVKATGLAAGKGVIVCQTTGEALDAIQTIMGDQAFGTAGATILIEEMLEGQEVSVLALVDGQTVWILDPCQDHKQVGEGDVGPNTGGMGAYCPTPVMTQELLQIIEQHLDFGAIDRAIAVQVADVESQPQLGLWRAVHHGQLPLYELIERNPTTVVDVHRREHVRRQPLAPLGRRRRSELAQRLGELR